MEAALKKLRIIQMTLVGSLGVFIYLIEYVHQPSKALKPTILWIMAAIAIYLIITFFSFRVRYLSPAREKLRLQPADLAALKKWEVQNIVGLGLSESLGLYGIMLRELGASFSQAAPFYAGGFLLLLLSTPRRP